MDEAEDAEYGRDVRGDELPEALRDRKARARALSEAKARLAAERGRAAKDAGESGDAGQGSGGSWDARDAGGSGGGAEAEVSALRRLDAAVEAREKVEHDFKERKKSAVARGGHAPRKIQQGNTTDADSRIMRTMNEGYQQCYNGQLAVDGKHQIVVLAEVVTNASDHGVLPDGAGSGEEGARAGARAGVGGRRGTATSTTWPTSKRRGIEGCVNPGTGQGGEGGGEPGGPAGDAAHGEEVRDGGMPGGVPGAEVAVGGAERVDQACDGVPAVQRARHGGGARGMEPGVPGVEHKADARAVDGRGGRRIGWNGQMGRGRVPFSGETLSRTIT